MRLVISSVLVALVAVAGLSSTVANAADMTPLVVNQWVKLEQGKPLTGSVVLPLADGTAKKVDSALVAMVGEDGKVHRSKIGSDGSFSFNDVTPGVYAFTARGKEIFSIAALHVVDAAAKEASAYPAAVEVTAAKLDYTTINTAIIRYLPPQESSQADWSIEGAKLAALAKTVVSEDVFRVSQVDGGMSGQIFTAGANGEQLPVAALTNVFVMSNGQEVARTVTSEDGRFSIKQLALGQYSVLAVGPSGLGLIGFELVSADAPATASVGNAGETLVTQHDCGCSDSFAMQVAPMPVVVDCVQSVVSEEIVVEEPCCGEEMIGGEIIGEEIVGVDGFGAPIPGGGYAGGYGGGYGGGFAGGGGGGLAGGGLGGIAGLAAIGGITAAAIAASDDEDSSSDFFGPLPSIPTNGGL